MSMILTYKYRIKDRSARRTLHQHAVAVNQVWNYCNALQRAVEARYHAGGSKRKWPTNFDLQKLTAGTSKYLGIHAQTISLICDEFVQSRNNARRSVRFRASGGARRALGWIPFKKQSRQIAGNAIVYLGKQFRWFGDKRRPLPPTTKGGTFVEDAQGKWWVCFDVEVDARPTGNGEVGIDLGLKTLATCSDGAKIEAPQFFRTYATKLAMAQRAGNRRRVRSICASIVNSRRDHLHKASCRIARANALIAVGNVSSPSLAKTRMAKSVYDAGWAMFRAQLRYKASRHGAVFLDIDEKFTTQVCSSCGAIPDSSPKGMGGLGMRAWDCSECGASHDRDVNAAKNILRLALSAQRPVEESRKRSMESQMFAASIDERISTDQYHDVSHLAAEIRGVILAGAR
jgi:putative transposase